MSQTRCAVYLRQSLDATGDQLAVTRQREDCQKIARDRGWEVVGEYVDNSVSASDKRKTRPAYDQLLKAHEAGEFDALVCWDLDRLTRQPRQLEDWIDAAEERGLVLVTANGEADLSTDGGRMFARIKATVARAEIERKSKRQQRAALQRSELGKPPMGVRLTGYETDGRTVPAEARIIRRIFARFNAGDSLKGIAAWLATTGVPTRSGAVWNPSSVRTILTNPRYAGRAIYQGKATGRAGEWKALVDEDLFDVVQVKLSDPRRRTQVGTHRKYLGAGLYLCGVCDGPMRSHSGERYRCPEGAHATRLASSIDAYVIEVLRARLAKSDIANLLAKSAIGAGQRDEIRHLRARLMQIEADYDSGEIDGRRYRVATEKVGVELATAEAAQARLLGGSGVASTIGAADPVAAFDGAPLGVQRAVLDFFVTVRLQPAPRGRKFDGKTVRIDWKP